MISYEHYKFLHLISIVAFFVLATSAFYLPTPSKKMAAGLGILSFLILLGGMGLMARLGIASEWPLWTKIKLVLWLLVVGGAHVIAKRVRNPARTGIAFLLASFFVAAAVAVYKPF